MMLRCGTDDLLEILVARDLSPCVTRPEPERARAAAILLKFAQMTDGRPLFRATSTPPQMMV
jgi:hypothetical protein